MKLIKHLLIAFSVLALFFLCYIMVDTAYTVVAIMAWKLASLMTALIITLIVCMVVYVFYLAYKSGLISNDEQKRRNR